MQLLIGKYPLHNVTVNMRNCVKYIYMCIYIYCYWSELQYCRIIFKGMMALFQIILKKVV